MGQEESEIDIQEDSQIEDVGDPASLCTESNSVVSNSDDEDRMSEEFGIIQTGGLLKLNRKDAPTLVYQMKILKIKNITMMKLKNSKL